jgi:hypothetical protein
VILDFDGDLFDHLMAARIHSSPASEAWYRDITIVELKK